MRKNSNVLCFYSSKVNVSSFSKTKVPLHPLWWPQLTRILAKDQNCPCPLLPVWTRGHWVSRMVKTMTTTITMVLGLWTIGKQVVLRRTMCWIIKSGRNWMAMWDLPISLIRSIGKLWRRDSISPLWLLVRLFLLKVFMILGKFGSFFKIYFVCAGECGLGKSTLVNSMFLADIYSPEHPGPSQRIKKTVQV